MGMLSRYFRLTRFSSLTHSAVAALVSFSNQRYGSATFSPKYSSTVLSFAVAGYFNCAIASVIDSRAAAVSVRIAVLFIVFAFCFGLAEDVFNMVPLLIAVLLGFILQNYTFAMRKTNKCAVLL